jgi:hypothetical protein
MLIGNDNTEPLNRILFKNLPNRNTLLHVIGQSLRVSYDRVLNETLPEKLMAIVSRIGLRAAPKRRKVRPGAKSIATRPTAQVFLLPRSTRRGNGRLTV